MRVSGHSIDSYLIGVQVIGLLVFSLVGSELSLGCTGWSLGVTALSLWLSSFGLSDTSSILWLLSSIPWLVSSTLSQRGCSFLHFFVSFFDCLGQFRLSYFIYDFRNWFIGLFSGQEGRAASSCLFCISNLNSHSSRSFCCLLYQSVWFQRPDHQKSALLYALSASALRW